MFSRLKLILAPLFLSFLIAACASAPVAKNPTPEHVAAAKRFLHSWDAGDVALAAFHRTMHQNHGDQPGLVELMQRIFAEFDAEDFENLAAGVYVRHLNQQHLEELARFTESPTGNRFFKMSVGAALEGRTINGEEAMREFSADELLEIAEFSKSDAFTALKEALPTINRELGEEGRRFAEKTVREYMERNGEATVGQSG